ncbi:Phage portal protein [Shimia gijangensis]|uniref:Phage portal protein n=1 Tax=Shimia gijangensis TaxID=1470563 RepID=A0A1M6RVA8_9RHOB|nr:phage portal protein [Shimia gijangensis]SHK36318.1 Phage portal protein [Shimia gijangensis]
MIWPFKRKEQEIETRASASGFTSEIMEARSAYIQGKQGLAELTATVQSCVGLWEGGLSLADVDGTDLLNVRSLGLAARSLALRGESLFLIREEGLIPVSDWELKTRNSKPTAYRISISEAGGGRTQTALAGEVLHFRIGCDVSAPYYGSAPLKRAQISAALLTAIEAGLGDVYETAPIGSQIVPFPEAQKTDRDALAGGFRGNRGKILLRESVNVTAAGGPGPQLDWKPHDLTPDLQGMMPIESLKAAQGAIYNVFGVLPGLANPSTTGPLVREAQRHLAQWQLQPVATAMAEECSEKLGGPVSLDVMRPLQAYDAGGRARAFTAIIQALASAKESGVEVTEALKLVDWE